MNIANHKLSFYKRIVVDQNLTITLERVGINMLYLCNDAGVWN